MRSAALPADATPRWSPDQPSHRSAGGLAPERPVGLRPVAPGRARLAWVVPSWLLRTLLGASLGRIFGTNSVGIKGAARIDRFPVDTDLEVKMGAGGSPGASHPPQRLPLGDDVAGLHRQVARVRVQGCEPVAVV